jgi:hypothetical protein
MTRREVKSLEERIRRLDPDAGQTGFVNAVAKLLPKELSDRIIKFAQHERYHWHRLLDTFTDQELERLLKAIMQVASHVVPTVKCPTHEGLPIVHALMFDAIIIQAGREGAKKHMQEPE